MGIEYKIVNLSELADAAVRVFAENILIEAKKRCPVETAVLKNSLMLTKEGNAWVIWTNVEYAEYVEYAMPTARGGTPESPITSWPAKTRKAQLHSTMPFLRSAAFQMANQLDKFIIVENGSSEKL